MSSARPHPQPPPRRAPPPATAGAPPTLPRREAPRTASYRLPVYRWGRTDITEQVVTKHWCPPESRKRPVDVLMLSIGGNDVGFSALVAYAMTESAADIAPIAGLVGQE